MKGIDAQLQYAKSHLDRIRDAPAPREDWEGKDKGRAEPLVATPAPEKPKGKVSVDDGNAPPMEGAKKAPDGNWYVEKNGKFFRVDK